MSSESPKDTPVITLDSPIESLLWSMRMARWNHKFPSRYMEMNWGDPPSMKDMYWTIEIWRFLAPFFALRGYTLYCTEESIHRPWCPPPSSSNPTEQPVYPYSRLIVSENKLPGLTLDRLSVWPACDKLGRDLIIKVISDASQPSDKLKIMQRLNDTDLRSDPFNHTIYAVEFLTFYNLVFAVMPRWDGAFTPEFANVSELMDITKTFLETFVFLHKNRIVHNDFLQSNTGMNVVMNKGDLYFGKHQGLCIPGEVRYTLIDFGMSVMYPEDSVIEDIVETQTLGYALRGAPIVEGPYNPFKVDIVLMGLVLQLKVRNIVPDIGPSLTDWSALLTQISSRPTRPPPVSWKSTTALVKYSCENRSILGYGSKVG